MRTTYRLLPFVALIIGYLTGCASPPPLVAPPPEPATAPPVVETAILRSIHASSPAQEERVARHVQRIETILKKLNKGYRIITDADLRARSITDVKTVILPHNPNIDPVAQEKLQDFLSGGGQLLGFGVLPDAVGESMGVRVPMNNMLRGTGGASEVRFEEDVLPSAADFRQDEQKIRIIEAVPGAKVAAEWTNAEGQSTGIPAVIVSAQGGYMSEELRTENNEAAEALMRAFFAYLKNARESLPVPEIALWHNTDAGRGRIDGDWRWVKRYVSVMRDILQTAGLPYAVVSDEGVAADALKRFKVAILPLNPTMPPDALKAAREFVAGGGKLFVFYRMPPGINEILGVEIGDLIRRTKKREFLTISVLDSWPKGPGAVIARGLSFHNDSRHAYAVKPNPTHVMTAQWTSTAGEPGPTPATVFTPQGLYTSYCLTGSDLRGKAQFITAAAAHFCGAHIVRRPAATATHDAFDLSIGRIKNLEQLTRLVESAPADTQDQARKELRIAAKAWKKATARADSASRAPEAYRQAGIARRAAQRAFCLSYPSRRKEMRGIWLHSTARYPDWDDLMKRLVAVNLNALFVNVCSSAYADYPSAILPMSIHARKNGDQMKKVLEAGRKHGIEIHAWMCCFHMMRASREYVAGMHRDDRLCVARDGRIQPSESRPFMCPSHAGNRKRVADAMIELTEKYHPDGIHFDYIRYPDEKACFCERCRDQFGKLAGTPITDWAVLDKDKALNEKFLQWRRDLITMTVVDVAKRSRAIDPKVLISAAVFANYPRTHHTIGQDWVDWMEKGYLDFVAPMNYSGDPKYFTQIVRKQRKWMGNKHGLYAGVALWNFNGQETVDILARARDNGADGFVLFELGDKFLEVIAPHLTLGMTRTRVAPR